MNQFLHNSQVKFIAAAGALAVCLMASASNAQDDPGAAQKTEDTAGQKVVPEKKTRKNLVSDEEAVTAMKFAADNHPELAGLLEQLRKSRPAEFQRAAKELTLQIQVLERIRQKNSARYESQLELWKQNSQIRVLMARWSRTKDPELEKQVRGLLRERHEAKVLQLQAEKERLSQQLAKNNEQLAALTESADSQLDREWEQLSKKAGSKNKSTVTPK